VAPYLMDLHWITMYTNDKYFFFSNHFCYCSQQPTMTDENEINVNGEKENSSQVPLSINISIHLFNFILLNFNLEMILETSHHSIIEQNIQNVLRKHFLEQRSITWKPIKVELIVNTQLTDEFFGKDILYKNKKKTRNPFSLSLAVLLLRSILN
jgi:hypothetical protein